VPDWLEAEPSEYARDTKPCGQRVLLRVRQTGVPVEQPTKFEFVINLTTAKALGLTIPASLMSLADELIE
jgi:putative ABC transport system substrate-binding protein